MYVLFLLCCRLAPPCEQAEWRWAGCLSHHPLAATGGLAGEASGWQRRPRPGTFLRQARGSPEEVLDWVYGRHAPDISVSAQSEQPLRPLTRQLSALAP